MQKYDKEEKGGDLGENEKVLSCSTCMIVLLQLCYHNTVKVLI